MLNGSFRAAVAAVWIFVCLVSAPRPAAGQSVPAPWTNVDVGSPLLTGTTTYSNGTFTIDAAGEDIWGTSDQFHFVYQAVSGDVDIRARVDSLTIAHRWTKAGLMIRSSLAANASHGSALVSALKGTAFQRRPVVNALSVHTAGSLGAAPRWVRLVRAGSQITAYESADGARWVAIGSDTVQLGTTAYVGLAVSSVHPGMRTTAAVSNLSLAAAAPAPPSALPDGQTSTDIGRPALAGRTSYSNGAYTIQSAGKDIWDGADQFHYVYQPVTGDLEVVARISSMTPAREWSKAGIMIRESLDPSSPHATAMITGAHGYALQSRAYPGAWSDHSGGGSGAAPGWLRLVRTGTQIEGFRSADGSTWVSIGKAIIAMNESVLVGLAVSSINTAVYTTAVVDRLTLKQSVPTANKAPSVVISSPGSGSTVPAGSPLAITAAASDVDGSIAAVDFHANGTLVGRDLVAPYTATVSSLAAGSYVLTATATDDKGATAISSAVNIVAASTTTAAPKAVAFTMSPDHSSLVTAYVLEIHPTGMSPGSSPPLASLNLGKPAPNSSGEIVVDCSAFFAALAPGTYQATVLAVGSTGSGRSEPVTFTR